jgi:hypothetical protein
MLINQMEQVPNGTNRAKIHYKDGRIVDRRIWNSEDSKYFAIYRKRSRSLGHWVHNFNDDVVAIELIPESKVDEATKWLKSWTKALKMINESGLWEDLKTDIELGLSIGYDKVKQAYDAYWSHSGNDEKIDAIRAIDDRLISKTPEGVEYIYTHVIWDMSGPAKIKKMYFGKYDDGRHLGYIADAMATKKPYSSSRITTPGYDVSFEYNPDKNKAWYSEEYRGCGNGHYYLAMNATHALFSEDD